MTIIFLKRNDETRIKGQLAIRSNAVAMLQICASKRHNRSYQG